jgi:hypothetical protein
MNFFNPEGSGLEQDNPGISGLKNNDRNPGIAIPTCRNYRGLQSQVDFKSVLLLHLFSDLGK